MAKCKLYPELSDELKKAKFIDTTPELMGLKELDDNQEENVKKRNASPTEGILIDLTENSRSTNLTRNTILPDMETGNGKDDFGYFPMDGRASHTNSEFMKFTLQNKDGHQLELAHRMSTVAPSGTSPQFKTPSPIVIDRYEQKEVKEPTRTGDGDGSKQLITNDPKGSKPQENIREKRVPNLSRSLKKWKKLKNDGFKINLQIGPRLCQWNKPELTDVIYLRIDKEIVSEHTGKSCRVNNVILCV